VALKRVLIADDHDGLVKAISRMLSLDYDVVGAVADGSAVLEAVNRLRPDVIVLDLNLPNATGLEVCRQIKDANPTVKVIIFTAMDDPDLRQQSLAVGASAFVCKVGEADLLGTINHLCGGRD
jgi:DNA-binding NarL/FixJ family response regulator